MTRIVFILFAVVAVGAVAMVPTISAAMAQGQILAPGQSDPNRNPSAHNGQLPPGQSLTNNPGLCQNSIIGLPKEVAHDLCRS